MSAPTEVDVVIAGGGSAGCVLAGRLAASAATSGRKLTILLIEAGANNYNNPDVFRPGTMLKHLSEGATSAKLYQGTESTHLAGRTPIVPVGNILGGGSSINFVMYTRGSASDYNDWNAKGWSTEELLPHFRRLETYHMENKDPKLHGFDGPIHVSYGGYRNAMVDEYLEAGKSRGYQVVDDLQDLAQSNAFEYWGKWIDPRTGRRQDAAHKFVHPQVEKGNLHLLCDSKVSRIIIENGRAVGVEYVPSAAPGNGPAVQPTIVRARKLVVVSAGTLGTPCILERSGIGNPQILRKAGVEPKVNLPGVGTNYQDHNLILPVFRVAEDTDTHDDLLRGEERAVAEAEEAFKYGKGKYATNMIDVGGKIRPTQKELETLGPEFKKVWDSHFRDAPDKPVMFHCLINTFIGDYALVPPGRYVTLAAYLEYPFSRGYIHIKSPSPYDEPEFNPNFQSHPADLPPMVWAYKVGRELMRRMPCYRGELPELHPKFSATSKARCEQISAVTAKSITGEKSMTAGIAPAGVSRATEDAAGKSNITGFRAGPGGNRNDFDINKIQDLDYSKEDDEAVAQWVRENVDTTWHSMGTCAMKPREKGGVVDEKLNVYGVKNLKIADLSICPSNVGANTNSTALMIGEKAASLVEEFLGLGQRQQSRL